MCIQRIGNELVVLRFELKRNLIREYVCCCTISTVLSMFVLMLCFFFHSSSSFGFYYGDVGDKKKQLFMSVCVCVLVQMSTDKCM